ncbi:uncharacterized protein DS421_1g15950 [Arachis hypogaea]|nr:uncharacterized protein DS421_1g15950 [Arachis hypogaea]
MRRSLPTLQESVSRASHTLEPKTGETLYLYLSITEEALAVMLIREDEQKTQSPIYFISIFWLKLRDLSKNLIQRLKRTADAVGF